MVREIIPGRPFSNRVRRVVDMLTCSIDTEWEIRKPEGTYENLLMSPPVPPGEKPRAFIDDEEEIT